MNTGEKIKEIRKSLKLTQKEFATLINKSIDSVKRYEANQNITLDTLDSICEKLAISPISLLTDKQDLFDIFIDMYNLTDADIDTLRIEFYAYIDFLVSKYNDTK
nr:helix-turn-helix transcriptional regulator [uncultured Cellulosilyticum sp.]